jgi:DNA-directed RNA polymerase specialized sigma24 family protein
VVVDTDKYDNMVASIAYEFSRKFHMCDADDIRQELWVWFLEHPNKVKTWEELEGKQSVKLIARSLRNAAKDYCQKEKANAVGYKVEDNYYYDREVVELLLPAVIRGDLIAPSMMDLGFVSSKKVASEGGNWFAMMGDIERGLRRLTEEQLSIVYLRFGDNCDNATLAKELAITEDAARMRVNRAVNNLLNFLGGSRPKKERDYTEEEANEQTNADTGSVGDIQELGDEVIGQDLD